MICKKCGAIICEKSEFCSECGAKQNVTEETKECPVCGEIVPSNTRYCSRCGKNFNEQIINSAKISNIDQTVSITDKQYSGMAIAGFILSFFSLTLGFIFSAIGLKQCELEGKKGKELAIAGDAICTTRLISLIIWCLFYYL